MLLPKIRTYSEHLVTFEAVAVLLLPLGETGFHLRTIAKDFFTVNFLTYKFKNISEWHSSAKVMVIHW